MQSEGALDLDGRFWRRLAQWGSSSGPEWFVRFSPPVVGIVACGLVAERRRHVLRNLHRVRGRRGALRDAVDVMRTFATYASCLAETLRAGSPGGSLPEAIARGDAYLHDALGDGRGVLLATAHTAGWEAVGSVLARNHGLRVMIAEEAERDAAASAIQDAARKAHGLLVVHVGDDPFAALPLARHLREGGAVALQIDRIPRGVRSRAVTMFGAPSHIPEGPLRLAMLTGAPLIPVFAARTGHRRYEVVVQRPIRIARAASAAELDAAAQELADAMQSFVCAHPTQWFHFRE
jgi:lauroyl/myristoyl acyltransferase